MRDFNDLFRDKTSFLFMLSECFPNNMLHTFRFSGKDTGFMKLDEFTQVYALFSHSQLLQMIVRCADGTL